jgi:hypothetical protein
MAQDKQLGNVPLAEVLEKRRFGQALNAKEFAVLAGISYSAAREWFRLPGFPVFRGFVFWQDFTDWRRAQAHLESGPAEPFSAAINGAEGKSRVRAEDLPPRAARLLLEVGTD